MKDYTINYPFSYLQVSRIRHVGLFGTVTMNHFRQFGRTPWTGISLSQGLCWHRTTQHRKKSCMHDLYSGSGIRKHNSSVSVAQDRMCLKGSSHWDRIIINLFSYLVLVQILIMLNL